MENYDEPPFPIRVQCTRLHALRAKLNTQFMFMLICFDRIKTVRHYGVTETLQHLYKDV